MQNEELRIVTSAGSITRWGRGQTTQVVQLNIVTRDDDRTTSQHRFTMDRSAARKLVRQLEEALSEKPMVKV